MSDQPIRLGAGNFARLFVETDEGVFLPLGGSQDISLSTEMKTAAATLRGQNGAEEHLVRLNEAAEVSGPGFALAGDLGERWLRENALDQAPQIKLLCYMPESVISYGAATVTAKSFSAPVDGLVQYSFSAKYSGEIHFMMSSYFRNHVGDFEGAAPHVERIYHALHAELKDAL